MSFRRLSPFVAVAFLVAHVAACACNASMSAPVAKAAHSCCEKHSAPAPTGPVHSHDSCCCSDSSQAAIAPDPATVAVELPVLFPMPVPVGPVSIGSREVRALPALPGSPPDVPLYTLHSTLLI